MPFGQLDVAFDPRDLEWGGRQLTGFFPVAEVEIHGLDNRYRQSGIGAPLAAGTTQGSWPRAFRSPRPAACFCMGGAVTTIIGAIRIPELSAAVYFSGIPPANVAKPADIRIFIQAHFANVDDWCTPEAVNDFEAALKSAGKSAEIFRYGAQHGFMNEQRPDVHQRQARGTRMVDSMISFWEKHL